jgi:chemotaxis protein CheC
MSGFNLDNVNDICLDALKEIGSIGAGNATTALAAMLNVEIVMKVPHPRLMEASDLGSAICPEDETIVGIFTEVSQDISGSMMFLMQMDSAHYLVNRMMGKELDNEDPFDKLELSAMKEIGNIIVGSYLSALSAMTRLTLTPSIPYIAVDMAGAILSVPAVQFGQYGNNALLIQTEFGSKTGVRSISGNFILMPEEESYEKILTSLGVPL